jgi:hypothetical protein
MGTCVSLFHDLHSTDVNMQATQRRDGLKQNTWPRIDIVVQFLALQGQSLGAESHHARGFAV